MTKVDHEALEELLRHASPRPTPSTDDEAAVRAAVRAEWRDLTGKQQTRRRFVRYAMAATVLVAVFAGLNTLRAPVVESVRVATIEKSIGPVYLLGEEAELRETTDLANVMSGQTIVTGSGAGLAIAWGSGGSVRLGENSRVEFTNDRSVFLESGRIYFDSQGSSLVADTDMREMPEFVLRTNLGDVEHLGTQYMTEVDSGKLVVSVREGKVAVDGTYHDKELQSGQQVRLVGSQQPSILSIGRSADAWRWVSTLAPPVEVEGRSLYEYLVWASREMGLELVFKGDTETDARKAILVGTIDQEPAVAVPLWAATAALESDIDEGAIHILESR